MIHHRSTQEPLSDQWLANLTVNCGKVLRQAEPVHLNRLAAEAESLCPECSHVDNEPRLPCVSYWEDTAK